MKIKFIGKYKSISSFESEELSDLTIITGKNGSGKTQLLFTIQQTFTEAQNNAKGYQLEISPKPIKVQIESLIYNKISASYALIKQKLDQYAHRFNSLTPTLKNFYTILYDNNIDLKSFARLSIPEIQKLLNVANAGHYFNTLLRENGSYGFPPTDENSILMYLTNVINKDIEFFEILLIIKKFKEKEFNEIDNNDFYSVSFPEKYIDTSDLFGSQVEMITYNYLKRRTGNDYQNYRKEKYGEKSNSIPDSEFEKQYPAPWEIINKILAEHKIDLRIQDFKMQDYSEQMVANAMYFKSEVKEPVSLTDLSSGEQVIISLILKLFTKDYYQGDLRFPDLIVLDEPDAYLHPEMSKLLIDVLNKSFVQDLGIKIILTTHSPATVALAPEDCIYEMKNTPTCSLKKN